MYIHCLLSLAHHCGRPFGSFLFCMKTMMMMKTMTMMMSGSSFRGVPSRPSVLRKGSPSALPESAERVMCDGTPPDSPSKEVFPIVVAGCASPVPGRTVEHGAAVIMAALREASFGRPVLHHCGQENEWLHRCFIATQFNVGAKTWKFFKKCYNDEIEFDEQQQWVRLRPVADPGTRGDEAWC